MVVGLGPCRWQPLRFRLLTARLQAKEVGMTCSCRKFLMATSGAMLCIIGLANNAFAHAQEPPSRSAPPAAAESADASRVGELTSAARTAEARINASAAEKRALLSAATPAEIKAALMRNGFTAAQLAGVETTRTAARVAAGKGAETVRIKITVRCCPLEIIISW